MDIFNFVSEGETLVFFSPEERLLAFWNRSLTINWYVVDEDGEWFAADCCTMEDKPDQTWHDARTTASEYYHFFYSNTNEG